MRNTWNLWGILNQLLANQKTIFSKLEAIMATLADIQAAVAAEKTVEDSAVALLEQLVTELKAAMAGNDPVAMQALVDQISANTQTLAAAVTANTQPPAP